MPFATALRQLPTMVSPKMLIGLPLRSPFFCTNLPAELIRAAAAAELQLRHVRKVRARVGRDLLDALRAEPMKDGPSFLELLVRYERLGRYEHSVLCRRKRSLRTIIR